MNRAGPLLLALSGYAGWAIGFSAIYAAQGALCEAAWSDAARRMLLTALFAGTGMLTVLPVVATRRFAWPNDTWRRIGSAANLSALVAAVWTGMPVLFATPCAG